MNLAQMLPLILSDPPTLIHWLPLSLSPPVLRPPFRRVALALPVSVKPALWEQQLKEGQKGGLDGRGCLSALFCAVYKLEQVLRSKQRSATHSSACSFFKQEVKIYIFERKALRYLILSMFTEEHFIKL